MLLKLNSNFQEYFIRELLGAESDVREVYMAVNNLEEKVALTVYDVNAIPEGYDRDYIPEVDLYPHFVTDAFPTFEANGESEIGGHKLKWVAAEFIEGVKLSDMINEMMWLPLDLVLEPFYHLLIGIKEISMLTNGGSHNNINPNNIIVTQSKTGAYKWYLTGGSCISVPCSGKLPFNINRQLYAFRAPETLMGRTSFHSDIFSLGVLLAVLTQGCHPWGLDWKGNGDNPLCDAIRIMRSSKPRVMCESKAIAHIISGALKAVPSGRWKTLEMMGAQIAVCMRNRELFRDLEAHTNEKDMSDIPCFDEEDGDIGEEKSAGADVVGCDDGDKCEVSDVIEEDLEDDGNIGLRAKVQFERRAGNGFAGVAGMEKVKKKLTRDFVSIMGRRDLAEMFKIRGANVIFYGAPGVGKTFIAQKLAEESAMISCVVNPSDLGNIYVHGTQNLIADVFIRAEALAKKYNSGVLLIFEEFDSMVPRRTGNDNSSQINEVAEFLARLNNCTEKNVFVVATTNRIDSIDPAAVRKGRFSEMIYIGLPDDKARKELLALELKQRPHSRVSIGRLVALTKGYNCSDISYIIEESARRAFSISLRRDRVKKISQAIIEAVIAETRPSVSESELKQYELSRDNVMQKNRKPYRKIGFVA